MSSLIFCLGRQFTWSVQPYLFFSFRKIKTNVLECSLLQFWTALEGFACLFVLSFHGPVNISVLSRPEKPPREREKENNGIDRKPPQSWTCSKQGKNHPAKSQLWKPNPLKVSAQGCTTLPSMHLRAEILYDIWIKYTKVLLCKFKQKFWSQTITLTLSIIGKKFSRQNFEMLFVFFPQKIGKNYQFVVCWTTHSVLSVKWHI